MKPKIPTRRMREHPDLEQLKRQAKELLRRFAAGDAAAADEVMAHYRVADAGSFALHDAQLVTARSYGFDSWPKLKAYVDGVTVRRLGEAVRANDLTQVRSMLKARPELADMQLSYGDERRAIHFAVMQRLPEMVRLLMRHGANARAGVHPHRDATAALTMARERGYADIVAIIEAEDPPRGAEESDASPEPRGDEAARAAVAAGDIAWLQAQQDLVNPVRWDDGGLLTVAVVNNRPEILERLLKLGWDPNERVSEGEGDWVAYSQGYPLWNCAALGRLEMAEMLLEHGADPNVHVDSSGSSVYGAFSHQQWPMVELLRRHRGVVTADTAAIYRQTELARQMLANDASASLAQELLRFGARGGDPEIVRMALERTSWARDDPRWFGILTEPLYFWHFIPWLYAGDRELDRTTYLPCFRMILARCDANLAGAFGRTALHEVGAMREHITEEEAAAFAEALLDAGARMDVRDELLKSTPLGWACRWGRPSVAKVLIQRGADRDEADAEEWARPRAWARKMGRAEVLAVLDGA